VNEISKDTEDAVLGHKIVGIHMCYKSPDLENVSCIYMELDNGVNILMENKEFLVVFP
jgi:hypothetical protein